MSRIIETMGARVKRLRGIKGWSQEQLAAVSGVEQAAISKIENADRYIIAKKSRTATPYKIAEALGISSDYLFTGENKEAKGPTEREVLDIYRNMDPTRVDAWIESGRAYTKRVAKTKELASV